MERKIIEIFGTEKIIVLVPGAGSEAGSDSDSDEERSSIKMNTLKCLTYNLHRKQDTFNQVRSFLHERLNSGIGLFCPRLRTFPMLSIYDDLALIVVLGGSFMTSFIKHRNAITSPNKPAPSIFKTLSKTLTGRIILTSISIIQPSE